MKRVKLRCRGLSLIETVMALAIFSLGLVVVIQGFVFVGQFSQEQKSLAYISLHVEEIFLRAEETPQGRLRKPYDSWSYVLKEKEEASHILRQLCFYSETSEARYYFYKVRER